MTDLTIKTNNQPYAPMQWEDLNAKEQREFDWMTEAQRFSADFVRYRGWVHYMNDFMAIRPGSAMDDDLKAWSGYHSDSVFSGVLCRITDDGDYVMGTYFS